MPFFHLETARAKTVGVAMGAFLATVSAFAQDRPLPVIDMHLHATTAASQGPPPVALCPGEATTPHDPVMPWGQRFVGLLKNPQCEHPIWSAKTDDELRDTILSEVKRLNVYAMLSGDLAMVEDWRDRSSGRVFLRGFQFNVRGNKETARDLEALFLAGSFDVLGEVTNQYAGVAPDDPSFREFWAMAERNDIPVGIHIGVGPPGAAYLAPGYRVALHDPLLLEDVLVRHPRLRVYVMHSGWPMTENLLGLLYGHPQVYVGVGVLQFALTRPTYYRHLERIVEAGFHRRILFGSDSMVWPGMLEEGIRAIEEAPFLSEDQKRDILYGNAARFLRLSEKDVAQHHSREE